MRKPVCTSATLCASLSTNIISGGRAARGTRNFTRIFRRFCNAARCERRSVDGPMLLAADAFADPCVRRALFDILPGVGMEPRRFRDDRENGTRAGVLT